jgi:hypothetical protein
MDPEVTYWGLERPTFTGIAKGSDKTIRLHRLQGAEDGPETAINSPVAIEDLLGRVRRPGRVNGIFTGRDGVRPLANAKGLAAPDGASDVART